MKLSLLSLNKVVKDIKESPAGVVPVLMNEQAGLIAFQGLRVGWVRSKERMPSKCEVD